jgi:eukaryotic-like serine/threonine-protein kinase
VNTYPSAVDYTLALQNPNGAFTDADLRAATFTQGLLGPYGIAGSSAVVFHGVVGGEDCALRCYTREDASTPERYALLSGFVADNGLSKYVGGVTWYQHEVQVKGAKWPVLKMAWIEGQQLNEYVGYLADGRHTTALGTLAKHWLELVNELQRVRFAHGDLQHGNILVDQQRQLRLVDFDSVWIPQLQGQEPPTESGHTSYQSQSGGGKSRWGPYMDTFSGLVIYLALTALAKDPGLWPEFNNGDNLLFERDDFGPPYNTGVWNRLAGLGDPDVNRIAARLKACCAPDWVASKSLRDTLAAKWWEQTGAPAEAETSTAPSVSAPASGTTPTAAPTLTWYKAASTAGHQASPTGSLPPPPMAPYQSAVAPQSGKSGSTTGSAGSGGAWYKQQQSKPPAPMPSSTPAQRPNKPKQDSQQVAAAWVASLVVVLLLVLIVVVIAVNH